MNIIVILILVVLSLWVTRSYDSVGTIGLVGIVTAGFNLSQSMDQWLNWVIGVISAILFVIGMLAPLKVDDWFHWSALLVNLVPWIVGWPFWTMMATLPVVLLIIGLVLALIGLVWVGTKLTSKVSKWRRSRHSNPAAAAAQTP
jgi:hypothetical protein